MILSRCKPWSNSSNSSAQLEASNPSQKWYTCSYDSSPVLPIPSTMSNNQSYEHTLIQTLQNKLLHRGWHTIEYNLFLDHTWLFKKTSFISYSHSLLYFDLFFIDSMLFFSGFSSPREGDAAGHTACSELRSVDSMGILLYSPTISGTELDDYIVQCGCPSPAAGDMGWLCSNIFSRLTKEL